MQSSTYTCTRLPRFLPGLLWLAFLLAACSGAAAQETPTPAPVEDFVPVVSATGVVVPKRWATLSTPSGGMIEQILVVEGQQVEAGAVLVQLRGQERLQASVSGAEFELLSAQQALQNLVENTAVLAAQALQTIEATDRALEDLQNQELQEALAQQAVADSIKAVEAAERNLAYLTSTAGQADIDAAKAQVLLAEQALERAEEAYEPFANRPEDNLTRANLLARLSAAQEAYDAAVRRLNALQGTGNPTDIALAQTDLATAQAQQLEAERNLARVREGPNPGDIALLEAQLAQAQRDYTKLSQGPDPDAVELAESRIANAEAQLAAAQAALRDLSVLAPFAGTISEILVRQSEWISPGQPVLLIADLSDLQIETTDLGEIDVSQVVQGETATITFDALPDALLQARVVQIAPKAGSGAGVNFKVVLEMAEVPEALRWGMTAFIDIETE